jgi:hypothetical protein
MSYCTGKWGQYKDTDNFLFICAQAIMCAAPDISASDMSSALDAIRVATKAIDDLTPAQKVKFEDRHWLYLRRVRPQAAAMAFTMALQGEKCNFQDEQFFEKW